MDQSRSELSIRYLTPELLRPSPHNSRTHNKRQIRQIAESIEHFGFSSPILISEENIVIAGHGRLAAAKRLGIATVPTICLRNLTEDQIRALSIADNKLTLNGGWNVEILAVELEHLLQLDSSNLDVEITGFSVPEIDLIIESAHQKPTTEDEVPAVDFDKPSVTELGDLWHLNQHKVLCGDSLLRESYYALMQSERAAIVVTDPPFNLKIRGFVTSKAKTHGEFLMGSGELKEDDFSSFLNDSLQLLASFSADNSLSYVFMDWRHVDSVILTGRRHFDKFVNLAVWVKESGRMGSFYRSQHELVLIFRKGKGSHQNNIQLGRFGRNRSNVWNYSGGRSQPKQGDDTEFSAQHPTPKPLQLVADILLDASSRRDIVLDAFSGSGTTILAAEKVGRVCRAIELDPRYVDLAIRRWQNYSGEKAIHAITGRMFDEIASEKEATHA